MTLWKRNDPYINMSDCIVINFETKGDKFQEFECFWDVYMNFWHGLRSRPIWASVLFTWGVSVYKGLNFWFPVWGGRSTLAGGMFTTDFKNKNLSRHQKALEKAVPVMFFEFCYSQPIVHMRREKDWHWFSVARGFHSICYCFVKTIGPDALM